MATSGSINYSQSRTESIQEALELIGAYDPEETVSSADYDTCNRSLNMMLKTWSADGVRLWKRQTSSLTMVASQASYTLGSGGDLAIDKPLRFIEARRRDSNDIDTPLTAISWQEYTQLSDKTTTGTPTQYHYQPGRLLGTLYIWPTANSTIATNDTLEFTYYSAIEDMDTASDDFDLPSEWTETVAYNLAVRIAPKFQVPPEKLIMVSAMANSLYMQLTSWDEEDTSVMFGPDLQ